MRWAKTVFVFLELTDMNQTIISTNVTMCQWQIPRWCTAPWEQVNWGTDQISLGKASLVMRRMSETYPSKEWKGRSFLAEVIKHFTKKFATQLWGTWVAQSVKHLPLAQVMISRPLVGLLAQWGTYFFLSFCCSACLCALCQIKDLKKKFAMQL